MCGDAAVQSSSLARAVAAGQKWWTEAQAAKKEKAIADWDSYVLELTDTFVPQQALLWVWATDNLVLARGLRAESAVREAATRELLRKPVQRAFALRVECGAVEHQPFAWVPRERNDWADALASWARVQAQKSKRNFWYHWSSEEKCGRIASLSCLTLAWLMNGMAADLWCGPWIQKVRF